MKFFRGNALQEFWYKSFFLIVKILRGIILWTAYCINQYVSYEEASMWLVLPTSDHQVLGLTPTGGKIQLMTIMLSLSLGQKKK